MRSANQIRRIPLEGASRAGLVLFCVAVLLLTAFATVANAQTTVVIPTTTTLWAGTADFNAFGLGSVTHPASGVILQGTAISKFTGKPVRHLWYGDTSNGLCRVDPEVDDPALVGPAPGIGYHFNVIQTCVGTINKAAFTPGQLAFDGSTNTIYTTDVGRTTAGIIRLHYVPTGDSGQGTIDPVHVDSLQGTQNTRNAVGGCPQVKDPKTGNNVPIVPDAAAIGPDGNLYVGSIRDGAIIRIIGPATFNPNTDCPGGGNTGVTPGPNDKIQIPLMSADEKFGSGHTFGLGWIGHTLFGADNIAPWILVNADQCLTPANGNKSCWSPALGGGAQMPSEILGALIAGPQAGAVSDSQYPTFPGNIMYFATFPNASKVTNITSAQNMTVQTQYGGTFPFITGLTPDPNDVNNANLYVGSDSTQGGINGAGSIWLVTAQAPAPGPPLAPFGVTATAGDTTATVNWSPTTNGQPITSYLVRTFLAPATPGAAPGPSTVPDVTVTATPPATVVPTTVSITGLADGTSYVFEVEACNSNGCSPFSPASNSVTPLALTVPPAPTNVSALAGTLAATLAWSQPGNGNSPITSSTITVTDVTTLPGTVLANPTVVAGAVTGGTVNGLLGGHSYSFTVQATNAVGTGPASASSNTVSIANVTATDLSLTMSSPATINAGSILTFTMTVRNNGPAAISQATLSDTLPEPFASSTTTQGACSGAIGVTSFSCNLGAMAAGSSATVTVSVQLPASQTSGTVTNSASVAIGDVGIADTNPANNSASSSSTINAPTGGGCQTSSTDVQIVGSAQNGGPAVNSGDTFTWQIKDNLGTTAANCVVFTSTLPSNFTLSNVTPTQGTCSNTGNAITCSLGTVNGGGQANVVVNFNVGATAGSFPTTGSVSFSGTDTNPSNNSFTVTVQPK